MSTRWTLKSDGGGTHVGIPLNSILRHALGSDVVDQLGSDAGENILESLSGHDWRALENKGEKARKEGLYGV